ncbi:hypothetical protein B0J12DRAFT_211537 [Macrophomina phaseolina]|uniref:Uncharacterized protein n=1 Tax=Macrophomina phaseolina TaxID=35725 RepID=A0ABQ8G4N1_9PEZI|nr:hypothetical protein B0J12DRAFT_211537 [Macrophomina phaseolina]
MRAKLSWRDFLRFLTRLLPPARACKSLLTMDSISPGSAKDDVIKACNWNQSNYEGFKKICLAVAKDITSFDAELWAGVKIPPGLKSYYDVPGIVRNRALDKANQRLKAEEGLEKINHNVFGWRMKQAVRFQATKHCSTTTQITGTLTPHDSPKSKFYDPIRDSAGS